MIVRDSHSFRPTQLPVVQHHTRPRAGPLAMIATACAVGLIVVIVLYGMTHEPQQQSTSAPVAVTTAPQTTGQGAGGQSTGQQNRGQQSQTPQAAPAGGDTGSATTGGSSAQPAPQAREKQPAPGGPAR
jgi:hypothetical protein